MSAINWRDIEYLKTGTPRQRSAYVDIRKLRVLESLAEFDPVLASTVNIDIDIPSSDLDIICEAHDLVAFETRVIELFGGLRGFQSSRLEHGVNAVVASFFHGEWEYEVFAQAMPVEQQRAFQHLVQTHRVVTRGGERWRNAIRSLKERGLKTEPAVVHALKLTGDPYEVVLSLKNVSDEALDALLARSPRLEVP